MSRDQKFKRKENGELVAYLLSMDKQIDISGRGQTYLTFYIWNECTQRLGI